MMNRSMACIAGALVLGVMQSAGFAATYTWTGGGSDNWWSNADNWYGSAIPINDGTADIVLTGNVNTSIQVDSAWNIKTLTFNSSAGTFALSGHALTVQGASSANTQAIANQSGNVQTINNALTAATDQGWNQTDAVGQLVINGNVTLNANVTAINSVGSIVLNGSVAGPSAYKTLKRTNSGTLELNGPSTYPMDAGTVQYYSGTVLVGNSQAFSGARSTAYIKMGNSGSSFSNTKLLTKGAVTVGLPITVVSTPSAYIPFVTLGGQTADTSVFSGNITLGDSGSDKEVSQITVTAALGGVVRFTGNFQRPTTYKTPTDPNNPRDFLTKEGAGTVILQGSDNNYQGYTYIQEGTLQVDGTLTSGGRPVIVRSGTTLSGIGSIARYVSVSGAIAPGASIGTLTTNEVYFETGGKLLIELGNAISDKLVVNGNLGIANGSLVLSGTPSGVSSLVIATYSGTLTGTFSSITGLPTGAAIDYGTRSNSQITLLIPEPASMGLLGLGTALVTLPRRMRK